MNAIKVVSGDQFDDKSGLWETSLMIKVVSGDQFDDKSGLWETSLMIFEYNLIKNNCENENVY